MENAMFYIYKFSPARENFWPIAAFTNKHEADAFVAENKAAHRYLIIAQQTFDDMIERALQARLGDLAKQFEKLGLVKSCAEQSPAA